MPFGLITIAFGHSYVCAGVGTASYSAPEQLGASGRYGMAVDIFPLGLILMELCCTFATGERGGGRYGMAVDIFPLGLILMELCCTFATGEAFFHLGICAFDILPSFFADIVFSFLF